MARISNVQPLVHRALIDSPGARVDDYILVLEVFKNFVNEEMSLKTVLEHHIELGLPSFASIIRIRRKLQKKYPELENAAAIEMRAQEETEYRAYAINS